MTPDDNKVTAAQHPSVQSLLQLFEETLFGVFARVIAAQLPANAEATTMVRKLLESQDCALRSQRLDRSAVQHGLRAASEHSSVQTILSFFEYSPESPNVTRDFFEFAQMLAQYLTVNAESVVAVRRLLEARDCALRALRVT